MNAETANQLLEINRRFYTAQAGEFAETRRRIQPGVRRILDGLPDAAGADWLDLGCGSGWLAVEWRRAGRTSAYTGLDFSPPLLAEAGRLAAEAGGGGMRFLPADFAVPGWDAGLPRAGFAGGLCFAVLHHLPGMDRRVGFLRRVADLLMPGARFWLSVWQFQHSPRLAARQIAWERAGLDDSLVEPGDTLLDWRRTPDGIPALRYVHRFTPDELNELARASGFEPCESFESDGQGGRLGLYCGWSRR